MQINIDPVKPSEVELLSNISTHCFYDTFHEKNTKENMKLFLDKSFNMDVLTQELQNSNNYFFFARMRDEVVGYIKMSDLETPPELNNVAAIEIARLYVIKEKIGRGIGRELMDFAFSFCQAN